MRGGLHPGRMSQPHSSSKTHWRELHQAWIWIALFSPRFMYRPANHLQWCSGVGRAGWEFLKLLFIMGKQWFSSCHCFPAPHQVQASTQPNSSTHRTCPSAEKGSSVLGAWGRRNRGSATVQKHPWSWQSEFLFLLHPRLLPTITRFGFNHPGGDNSWSHWSIS